MGLVVEVVLGWYFPENLQTCGDLCSHNKKLKLQKSCCRALCTLCDDHICLTLT